MLKIYNPDTGKQDDIIPLLLDDNKRFVTHKYDGADVLTFEIATTNEAYKYISEEVKVEDEKNQYIIKKIDEHSDFVTVDCNLNTDDWRVKIFSSFRRVSIHLIDLVEEILPAGWSCSGFGNILQQATIEGNEGEGLIAVTPLDIMNVASEAFGCVFNYDCINKIVKAIDVESITATGEFFTDEINLRSVGYVGDSTNFATRLYAYGKRDEETGIPLTFADINDGKEYVEDLTYIDKVISIGWSDERYTIKENLLEAAKEKLKEISYPLRSYSCDVINLEDDVWMYKIVTLIDRVGGVRVDHQVVEYKEYPNHELDVVTLSATVPNLASEIQQIKDSTNEEFTKQHLTIQKEIKDAVDHATKKITGNDGGYFAWVFDNEGKPIELLNFGDGESIDTAQRVWRWNASGLGHSNNGYEGPYDLALLDDGSINADRITVGTLTAGLIRAGVLSDVLGNISWNLETGALLAKKLSISTPNFVLDEDGNVSAKNAKIEGEISSSKIVGGEIEGAKVTGTTIDNGNGTFQVDANGNALMKNATVYGHLYGIDELALYNALYSVHQKFVDMYYTPEDPQFRYYAPGGRTFMRVTTQSGAVEFVNLPLYISKARIDSLESQALTVGGVSGATASGVCVEGTARVSGVFVTFYGTIKIQKLAVGDTMYFPLYYYKDGTQFSITADSIMTPKHRAVKASAYYGKRALIVTFNTSAEFSIRNVSNSDLTGDDLKEIAFRFDYIQI